MTETAPPASPPPDEVFYRTLDFAQAVQDYLANDPDPRAADLLVTAVEIIDALLAGDGRMLH